MEFKLNTDKIVRIFIPVFYSVGIAGFLIPLSHPYFEKLIPLALILSFILLVLYHPRQASDRISVLVFAGIYFAGLIVEMIGVNTGSIFGEYSYGPNLGIKILNTPVIIGLNWLILVYTTSSLFEKLTIPNIYKILLASACMLAYDIVLEQIAPLTGMWSWHEATVPVRNYMAWFIIAVVFQSVLKLVGIKTENAVSKDLFYSQFIFFLILLLFLH